MSKYSHRQPVWTWSSVVLLSTLLLSPVATNTLLRALGQALPQNPGAWANNAPTTPEGTPAEQQRNRVQQVQAPRRSVEEEEALLAAARSGKVRAVRLDSDPDNPDAAIALLVPARAIVRLPDVSASAPMTAGPETFPSTVPRSGIIPRAPPV